jgi:hypothetical protein
MVLCLGEAVLGPEESRVRESLSLSAKCSAAMPPILAAASSKARGMPSSLRHTSATARAFSDVIPKSGSLMRARSTKSLTAPNSGNSSSRAPVPRLGHSVTRFDGVRKGEDSCEDRSCEARLGP